MTETALEVGDFVRNKIHGFTAFLITRFPLQFYSMIVEGVEDNRIVGYMRMEITTELEKIPASLLLIHNTKVHLKTLHSVNNIDNLTYIELLHKLNEKEKELKNENEAKV